MIRRLPAVALAWSLAATTTAAPSAAQVGPDTQPAPRSRALRVYLDCRSEYCDSDFFRTEIAFVDHVRDRQLAQVHVLVLPQRTGGGGTEFTISFIGQQDLAGEDDSLRYVSRQTDTRDEVRRALARVMKLGLVRYAARTPAAERLQVVYAAEPQQAAAASTARDPWDYWVFTLSGNGNFNGEKTSRLTNVFGSVSARRVTQAWKISISSSVSYGESRFELTGGTFTSYSHSYGGRTLVVRSVDDHWSVGGTASANASTFVNQNSAYRVAPAIEYNVFPYSQSTRRQLTLRYSLGVTAVDYLERTIFNELSEQLPDHNLTISLDVRQPWGSANLSVEGGQYLHDHRQHHATMFGGANLRLVKGLSLNLFGSVQSLRDQRYLSGRVVTDEEALLRLRQRATTYRYSAFTGLSYTFGSAFNNVVNPRFGSEGGGTIFFF